MFEFIEKWKERSHYRKCERIERQSKELYQIREYDGELWLTFGGALICSCEMLAGDDSIATLQEIRDNYVKRHTMNL